MAEAILNQPHFQDADAAREYLEKQRWPHGPVCPHCGSINNAARLQGEAHRPGLLKCRERECRKQFSVTVGTVFEDSKVPLNLWLQATYLMCASKKGVSSKQLERMFGCSYRTAWFMTHRIRAAMESNSAGPLGGEGKIVEADETFWGNKGKKRKGARGYDHKMKIVSLVERDGSKRSFHVADVTAATVAPILREQVAKRSRLMTDEAAIYTKVGREFVDHGVVRHNAREYSRGDVHSNTVESSFALLKRGLHGTFHSVSEQHLQRYATEFDYRWNHRQKLGFTDVQRADVLLRQIAGKRLTYRAPRSS